MFYCGVTCARLLLKKIIQERTPRVKRRWRGKHARLPRPLFAQGYFFEPEANLALLFCPDAAELRGKPGMKLS
jgi:hypothetical protein